MNDDFDYCFYDGSAIVCEEWLTGLPLEAF
jgi:hypothetical protein